MFRLRLKSNSIQESPVKLMEIAQKHLTSRLGNKINELFIVSHEAVHPSFYECFAIHGMQIQKLEPGHVLCIWKVPAHLTDDSGALHAGVIATIVDDVGAVASLSDGRPPKVSVDMNISYLSAPKVNDEIEIHGRVLGHKEGFSMTYVNLRNKATGELLAEGRHSLYSSRASKL